MCYSLMMKNDQFKPKKSLGQHFLTSEGAVDNIIETSNLSKKDLVLEIGPGRGVLTTAILKTGAGLIAVEKDDVLIEPLKTKFEKEIKTGKLEIVHADILETDIEKIVGGNKYKLVANIPYYITGEIIRKFLTSNKKPELLTILVQKEVAERIVAKNGKESVLSLSVKFFGEPFYIQTVKKGSFNPPPNVDSAILRVEIRKKKNEIREEEFFKAVKTGFSSKRKKLISNLSAVYEKDTLTKAFLELKMNENTRAEDLGLEKWIELLKQVNL
jgi:16S rRNA (adenine1518-N6/adenine1519-N6)-dimethyltransferase